MKLHAAGRVLVLIFAGLYGSTASADPLYVVRVSKQAGDYANPVEAVKNAFQGVHWCHSAGSCRIEIDRGIFVLPETLVIPDGVVLRGAGKRHSLLVADRGVAVAVLAYGPGVFDLRDLTIVNHQPDAMLAVGFRVGPLDYDIGEHLTFSRLVRVAIQVGGAEENVALSRYGRMFLKESDLTAPDGIGTNNFMEGVAPIRMEDSTIAARVGIHQEGPDQSRGTRMQLVNSQVITSRPSPSSQPGAPGTGAAIALYNEDSTLDVQGGFVAGSISAEDEGVSVRLSGTHVVGGISFEWAQRVLLDDVIIEGNVHTYDGARAVTIRNSTIGTFRLRYIGRTRIVRSVIQRPSSVEYQDVTIISSVLASPIDDELGGTLTCIDTIGADYRPVGADCHAISP